MKTLTHFFLLLLLSMFSLFNLGCPDEKKPPIIIPPTPTNCEYPPGNRNFTWRLDTVAWWPSWLGGVHAFSDSDAWVMGSLVSPTGESYVGWHWDGKKWNEKVDFLTILMKPNDVAGDDNYMVSVGYLMFTGIRPAIAEFNNRTKQWQRYDFAQTPGELRSVWTDGKGYFIAVGDNGMVYTKDGYTAEWVYSKAPTEFNFTKVTGINKNEMYFYAHKFLISGESFSQIWKYFNCNWTKLLDTQDSVDMAIQISEAGSQVNNIAVSRCSITDSLLIYIVGKALYEFSTEGHSLVFKKKELAALSRGIGYISLFSPKDYWISALEYQLYHWNGSNLQKIEPIPTLPYGQLWGDIRSIRKGSSGKIWMVVEMSSQVYAVIQGTP